MLFTLYLSDLMFYHLVVFPSHFNNAIIPSSSVAINTTKAVLHKP
jgi:hypothetical protein